MSPLIVCIFVTFAGMFFIPASPVDTIGFTKMVAAIVFIVLVWVLFVIGGAPLKL